MHSSYTLPEWVSLEWFYPSVLRSFHWDNVFFLYLLPVVLFLPLLRWSFHIRFRQKLEIGRPSAIVGSGLWAWLRLIPTVFYMLFATCVILALARPQTVNSDVSKRIKGIDLMFVLDISESMMLEDFVPNRLEVAKNIVSEFVEMRTQDKIGIVVFSGEAYSLVPLTTDYELIAESIASIKTNRLDTGATAIGNALGVGINRLRDATSKTKIIILLSDGDNTAGNLHPQTAAMLAKKFDIKIFTIGVGKNGEAPYGKDSQGNKIWVTSTLDENSLREIAQISSGFYFKAADKASLKNCFAKINRLAKNSFTTDTATQADDYYTYYLYWALVFLIIWLGLKSSFLNNFLED